MIIHIYIYKREDGLNAFNGALFTAHTAAAAAAAAPIVATRKVCYARASAIIGRLNINFKLNFTQVKTV